MLAQIRVDRIGVGYEIVSPTQVVFGGYGPFGSGGPEESPSSPYVPFLRPPTPGTILVGHAVHVGMSRRVCLVKVNHI